MELGALVILKRDGQVYAMNPLARRLLTPDDARRLSEFVSSRMGVQEEGWLGRWDRPAGQTPWLLWVTPMTNGSPEPSHCAVALCDTNPSFEVSSEVLVSLFRLTRAEVRLAQQILAGRTPAEAAAEMCVTIHTVRTYLKRLYLKTGVKTQACLVRKLLQCSQLFSAQG